VQSALTIIRYVVFGLFMVAVIAAVGSWLVRTRKIPPFSWAGRTLRSVTDLAIRPVERQVHRRGGNPTHAGTWLVVIVAAVGVILIVGVQWVMTFVQHAYSAFTGNFRTIYHFVVGLVYSVLLIALIMRTIGTWFGKFEHTAWMRPAYWLTDWIVKPVRRFLPPMGGLDVSPIVAWLALWIIKVFLLAVVP
jgi:YggT family protein